MFEVTHIKRLALKRGVKPKETWSLIKISLASFLFFFNLSALLNVLQMPPLEKGCYTIELGKGRFQSRPRKKFLHEKRGPLNARIILGLRGRQERKPNNGKIYKSHYLISPNHKLESEVIEHYFHFSFSTSLPLPSPLYLPLTLPTTTVLQSLSPSVFLLLPPPISTLPL